MFGNATFSFAKAPIAVQDSIYISGLDQDSTDTVLDYFAGSGTTGHAVINLNREDGGQRKYILVEMGEYFDAVTKPRILKVIYASGWKDGKPTSRDTGVSHCLKYLRLESYEDTLNNLQLRRSDAQGLALGTSAQFREGYLLHYWLDVESRESLLNLGWFDSPDGMYLNVTRQNDTQPRRMDLVETFNYLIGLVVESHYAARGFRVVTGTLRTGERTLVVWRNVREHDNDALNAFLEKQCFNPRDSEFDRIYVNGDNTVENLKTGEERWKVGLIEEEFHRRMFTE